MPYRPGRVHCSICNNVNNILGLYVACFAVRGLIQRCADLDIIRTGAASDDGQLRNARAQVAGGKRLRARVNRRRKTVRHNWRVSDIQSGAENERRRRSNNVVEEAKHMIPANVSSFVRAELSLTSSFATGSIYGQSALRWQAT